MTAIAGLLLAAGSSRRFGADKRWHRLADGTPMALASARKLLAACPDSVAVVRADDTELAALLTAEGLRCVVAEQAGAGMGHSLAAGVAATAAASGWLVALADMPFIKAASYAAVLAALAGGARIARPLFDGRRGHPVGFAGVYRQELLALSGDEGGKAIIARDPTALCGCPVDDPGVLQDVDRPGGRPIVMRCGTVPGNIHRISSGPPALPARQGVPMDARLHTMNNLFAQLGLPADDAAIDRFIATHRPLGNDVALYRAPFWTPSQRAFLKEEIIEDADWAAVIDELNSRLS